MKDTIYAITNNKLNKPTILQMFAMFDLAAKKATKNYDQATKILGLVTS